MKARPPVDLALLTVLPLLVLQTITASARVITVDPRGGGNHLTIQPAINEADPGDTVLVAVGTYTGAENKNLNFGGKDIVLLSAGGPEVTIIDGEGSGRGFTFSSVETNAAIVNGFTIINAPTGSPIRIVGGSSPTMINCVVRNNEVTTNSGGGVFIEESSPRFLNCVIADNTNTSDGGGIYVSGGAPSFTGCMIVGNLAGHWGGGARFDDVSTPTVESCTITANLANNSGGAFDGGGLTVSGSSSATVLRTIIWGNQGDIGHELFVLSSSSVTLACCDIDSMETGGAGQILYGPNNVFTDPYFCGPACCWPPAWDIGDYTLSENSPCKPVNSPCGFLIGARAVGCGTATVWTGAVSNDWDDPLNWSTGQLPGPADHVQLKGGTTILDIEATIERLMQCPESPEPDTLRILAGGILNILGTSPHGPADFDSSATIGGSTLLEDGLLTFAPGATITECGELVMSGGSVSGPGGLTIEGRLVVVGPGVSAFNIPINNLGTGSGTLGPRGTTINGGTLAATLGLVNSGQMSVETGATLQVGSDLTNLGGGVITLEGGLTGSGVLGNLGLVTKTGAGTSMISVAIENDRDPDLGQVGEIQVSEGSLSIIGPMTNHGEATVEVGADLEFDGTIDNLATGELFLTGSVTGTGALANLGTVSRIGAGASPFLPTLDNRFDMGTGDRGRLRVVAGSLDASSIENSGILSVDSNATLTVSSDLTNRVYGVLAGTGELDVSGAAYANLGTVSPGFSPGDLRFTGSYQTSVSSRLRIEIGGRTAGSEFDQVSVDGSVTYGGAMHVRLIDDFIPSPGDSFTVVTVSGDAFASNFPGGGAPTGNGSRTLPSFDCFSGLQIAPGLYLDPVALSNRFVLVAKDTLVSNAPPLAHPDTFTAYWGVPATLTPLDNDSDQNGDDLSLVFLNTSATQGVAFVDSGDVTISYLPPLAPTGTDILTYGVTDCNGGVDSAFVLIELIDPTSVSGTGAAPPAYRLHPNRPNPFSPVTRIRFELPRAGEVRLAIYDISGRRIRSLASGFHEAGVFVHDWWGRDDLGREVPAGVYIARFEAGQHVESRKLLRVR